MRAGIKRVRVGADKLVRQKRYRRCLCRVVLVRSSLVAWVSLPWGFARCQKSEELWDETVKAGVFAF